MTKFFLRLLAFTLVFTNGAKKLMNGKVSNDFKESSWQLNLTNAQPKGDKVE